MEQTIKIIKTRLLATALACLAGSAQSDIIAPIQQAQDDNGQFVTADVTITHVGNNRYNVVISSNVNGSAVVLLDSDDANDIIQNITILPGCCAADQIILTIRQNTSEVARSSIQGVEKIEIWDPSNTYLRIAHIVIDGDLGTGSPSDYISASDIDLIDITGDLFGNIIIDNEATASVSNTGNIVIQGDVVGGGIYNNTGAIELIRVYGNAVPDGGDYPEFWSSFDIGEIDVFGNFAGRIGSNGEGFSGHPDVGLVEIAGDFTGSSAMTVNSLGDLTLGGNYDATMTINSAMANSGSLYDISGSIMPSASIALPAGGLVGQIVANSGDSANTWSGDVIVGTEILSTDYTNLSSDLGGGAVGLAPFNFHQRETAPNSGLDEDRDCDPYQNEIVPLAYDPLSGSNEAKNSVTIAHYGSVYADGAGPHFRVEFRPDIAPFPSTPAWEDRTSLFEIDATQSGTSNLTGQPTLVIKATASNKEGFRAAGRWRIRPIAGKVKCSDVAGNPEVDYQSSVVSGDLGSSTGTQYSWYAFRTMLEAPSGAMLLNTGNGPQPSDISTWLTSPFEVNADGETNAQDFIDMANQYTGN